MRSVLSYVIACVLFGVLCTDTNAALWKQKNVPVWDYTSEEWQSSVQATVEDFNAHLPSRVPRLQYVAMPESTCGDLPTYGQKHGISACVGYVPDNKDGAARREEWRGKILRALITFSSSHAAWSVSQHHALACHEMTHALLDTPDDYSNPHINDSCVQGFLDHLGSWDIAYATEAYGRRPLWGRRH